MMTASPPPPAAAKGVLGRLRGDRGGLAVVEFALIAPVLILFYFGAAELSLALMAQKRAAHVAAAIGDLVAQDDSIQASEIADIYTVSRTLMSPFSADTLRLRVTHITKDQNGNGTVDWASSSNWTDRGDAADPSVAALDNNQSMVLAETEYTYQSPVGLVLPNGLRFRSAMPYRPRKSNQVTCATVNDACPL